MRSQLLAGPGSRLEPWLKRNFLHMISQQQLYFNYPIFISTSAKSKSSEQGFKTRIIKKHVIIIKTNAFCGSKWLSIPLPRLIDLCLNALQFLCFKF